MPPRDPSFLGARSFPSVALPQLPAAFEAAAVVAAVMGFGLAWAWLATPTPRELPAHRAYAVVAMSPEWLRVQVGLDVGLDAQRQRNCRRWK